MLRMRPNPFRVEIVLASICIYFGSSESWKSNSRRRDHGLWPWIYNHAFYRLPLFDIAKSRSSEICIMIIQLLQYLTRSSAAALPMHLSKIRAIRLFWYPISYEILRDLEIRCVLSGWIEALVYSYWYLLVCRGRWLRLNGRLFPR